MTKPAKQFVDSSGQRTVKGNMNIELAVQALELAGDLDEMVLFSGDGDFRSLVEAVQRRGVRVTMVSTIERRPPAVAVRLPARRTSSPTWSSLEPSSIGIGPVVRPHASAAMLLVRRCGAPPLRGRVRSPTNSFPNSWRVPEWDFGLPTFVHYFATATSNA
ncbi:hypothetical protein ACVWZZ_001443 [Bradyrhizobium sp. LM6.10]